MTFSSDTLQKARESGYSDDDIYSHLADSDPRFKTAKEAGYSLDDVAAHFGQREAVAREGLRAQEMAFGPLSPLGATIAANHATPPEPPPATGGPGPMGALPGVAGFVGGFHDLVESAKQWTQTPLISPELTTALSPVIGALRGGVPTLMLPDEGAGAGLKKANEILSGFTTPQNLGLAAAAILAAPVVGPEVVGGAFAGLAGKHAVQESIPEAVQAYKEHGLTSPEFGSALVGAGADVGMAAGAASTLTRPAAELAAQPETANAIQEQSPASEVLRPESTGEGGNMELRRVEQQDQLQQPAETQTQIAGPENAQVAPVVGPALRNPGETAPTIKGEIGQEHGPMKIAAAKEGVDVTDAEHGFHDANGNFLTRTEGAQRLLDTGEIDQAKFDKMMAREEPGATSQDLQDIAKAKAEPPQMPLGPGKMTAGELPPQQTTGLQRAVVDTERLSRGLPEIPTPERQREEGLVQQAEDFVESNPEAIPALVERINSGEQRGITEQQAAQLLVERQRLHNVKQHAETRLADPDTPPEERGVLQSQWQDAEARLNDLDNAQRTVGTTWGRLGHMYQRLIQEDFTLAAMERRARAAKGGQPLTREESAKLAEQAQQIKELQEAVATEQTARATAEESAALKDVYEQQLKETQAELEKRPQFGKEVFDIARGIVNRWKAEADVARKNLASRLGRTSAGVDPTILVDVAKIMRAKVGEFGLDFAKASAEMIAEFGEQVKPYLEKAWAKTQQMIGKETTPSKVKEAIKKGEATPKPAKDLKAQAKAEAAAGLPLSHELIYELGKQKIEQGVRGENEVAKAIHDEIKDAYPDATERDVRRAYVDYGKEVAPPNPEEVATHQRLIRSLFKIQEDIDRLNEGLQTWKSQKRDKAVLEVREKMAKRAELLKKLKAPPGPEELASRDQARQTQVRNAIEALDKRLRTGEAELKRTPAEPSPQLEQLKSELQAMRDLRDKLEREQKAAQKTPETEAQDALNKAAVAREAVEQRLNDISQGNVDVSKPEAAPSLTALEDDMRAETEALRQLAREMRQEMKKAATPPKPADEVQVRALEKAIAKYDEQLASGKLSAPARRMGPDTARVAALKEIRDSRAAALKAARRAGKPVESAAERYNRLRIKAVEKATKEGQERIARGDFTKRPKKVQPAKNAETLAAEAKLAQVKVEVRRGEERMRLARRTRLEKTLDGIVKWRRAAVLTGLHSLAKLTSAAGEIMGITPVEEAIGGAIGKVIPSISEKAPRHGGFSPEAEVKAVVESWKNLLRDAGSLWKTGNSELDLLYGKPNVVPPELKDFVGRVHSILKSPAKRNEFTRSFEKRIRFSARQGADVTDPLVQTKIAMDAYKDAQKSIFNEDNMVVDAYKRALSAARKINPETGQPSLRGKLAETALKTTIPIVRIPTNIVARTFEYSLGHVSGAARIARAMWKGLDNLKPEEADAIMRNLKRGSLGAAVFALGFLNPKLVGGYYAEGVKRDEKGPQYGGLRIGGHDVPRYLVHNPLLEQLQIGATVRHVMESRVRKSDKEGRGLDAGLWASLVGVLEETPLAGGVTSLAKLAKPEGGSEVISDIAQMPIPQLVQERAKEGIPFVYPADRDANGNLIKRKPRSIAERVKLGIPGLRKTVPEAQPTPKNPHYRPRYRPTP